MELRLARAGFSAGFITTFSARPTRRAGLTPELLFFMCLVYRIATGKPSAHLKRAQPQLSDSPGNAQFENEFLKTGNHPVGILQTRPVSAIGIAVEIGFPKQKGKRDPVFDGIKRILSTTKEKCGYPGVLKLFLP